MEVFPEPVVAAAAMDAIQIGAISFDASSNSPSPRSNADPQSPISATIPICPPPTSRQLRPPIISLSFPGAAPTSPAPPQVQAGRVNQAHPVAYLAAQAARRHAKHMLEKTEKTLESRALLTSAKVERAVAAPPATCSNSLNLSASFSIR